MVPFYILVTKFLGMKDSIWVMIIPYLVGSWNVILMRNYYLSVPESITEAAKIDGAGDFRTFVQIVIPLSKPAFATIGLFVTMGYWNDWWLALLFVERRELFPLQYMLQAIMQNIDVLMSNINTKDDISLIPSETIRMATCVMAVGPILLAYPFFQKFIVKGLTVGAVKG
jgi:putative aldouronate transport system permease protein